METKIDIDSVLRGDIGVDRDPRRLDADSAQGVMLVFGEFADGIRSRSQAELVEPGIENDAVFGRSIVDTGDECVTPSCRHRETPSIVDTQSVR
jgi:hypothetical protein